jgi:hypothetical protein
MCIIVSRGCEIISKSFDPTKIPFYASKCLSNAPNPKSPKWDLLLK